MTKTLIICCGALIKEIQFVKQANHLESVELASLPAVLHNSPDKVPGRIEEVITKALKSEKYLNIFVAYADCGTGGQIDKLCTKYDIKMLPGAHCYQFYAGDQIFLDMHTKEPGTFYLTDFLAKHFFTLVAEPLKLTNQEHGDELKKTIFNNYSRLLYLSQIHDDHALLKAKEAADFLELEFVQYHTGLAGLSNNLKSVF